MSNREIVINLINQITDRALLEELYYYMDVDRAESGYDLADALNDAIDLAEYNGERKLTKTIRLILIKAGYMIEAKKSECGRDTRVLVNGKKYGVISHWEGWINE